MGTYKIKKKNVYFPLPLLRRNMFKWIQLFVCACACVAIIRWLQTPAVHNHKLAEADLNNNDLITY